MPEQTTINQGEIYYHKTWFFHQLGIEERNLATIREKLDGIPIESGYIKQADSERIIRHWTIDKDRRKKDLELEKLTLENELLKIKRDKEMGDLITSEQANKTYTLHIIEILGFLKKLPYMSANALNPLNPEQ